MVRISQENKIFSSHYVIKVEICNCLEITLRITDESEKYLKRFLMKKHLKHLVLTMKVMKRYLRKREQFG